MDAQAPPSPPTSALSRADHLAWRDFLRRHSGLDFPDGRVGHLGRCLDARMRRRGITDHSEYYRLVAVDPSDSDELSDLLDLLTNNHSDFFRHAPSFDALTSLILPRLMVGTRRGEVAMWSAGCASGQEAYSMAMAFLEVPGTEDWQARITGSDINRRVLRRADRGRYRPHEVRAMPDPYHRKYLVPDQSEAGDPRFRVADRARSLARFRYLNLVDEPSYGLGLQDVIFCQNVLIYFGAPERSRVVASLCRRLSPGGFLVLGPTDLVDLETPGMTDVGLDLARIYQRTS